jgi:transcriptional regulator with XRE-family HTH domain
MRQLAERAGVSHNQINTMETGKISPLLDTMVRVAAALGVPLTELAYGEAEGERPVLVPTVPSPAVKRLDEMVQSLGREDRELALALAEAVVEELVRQRAEQAVRRARRRTG